jgi:hypothetical protein
LYFNALFSAFVVPDERGEAWWLRQNAKYRKMTPGLHRQGKLHMLLLGVYLALMVGGSFVAYLIGLVIEQAAPSASLPAFLAMYFAFLWIGWLIAVRLTKPREESRA